MSKKKKKQMVRKTSPQSVPGYDGNPPVVTPIRDPEGKGKREIFVTRRLDRLQWLLDHKSIDEYQFGAGRRLQNDWEASQRGTAASVSMMSGVVGGVNVSVLADCRLDAMTRYADAIRAVPVRVRATVELALIDANNYSVEKISAILRIDRRAGQERLQIGLDALAEHYGLKSRA